MALEMVQRNVASQGGDLCRLVEIARIEAATINVMAKHLMDIYRMEAGQMPLDKTDWEMTKAIRGILERFAPSANDRKLILVSSVPVTTFSDAELIRRVIENLVGNGNAIKFTGASAEVRISVLPNEKEVRVIVADNGPGIPTKYHQRIFELFGQANDENKATGTGLGLAFCKLAVEAHSGCIGLESEVGRGSRFWFTLPSRERVLET
jgi:signal transduction histidine kinase